MFCVAHLASHSPQCMCVCPGRAAVCGWECTRVGWTEGTLVVTGWSPTAETEEAVVAVEEEEVVVEEGGVGWEAADGVSLGLGMAVVGLVKVERGEAEEVEETEG